MRKVCERLTIGLKCCVLAVLACVGMSVSVAHAETPVPAARQFTLVIDAGHGGHDPGAVGKTSKEKDINLATALAFGRLVEKNLPGVKVIYTRSTDKFVTLSGRASIANKAKADLFVSIHTNALPKGKISRGAETYTLGMARAGENLEVAKRENSVILQENDYKTRYQGFDPRSSESYIIFELLQDRHMEQSVRFAKMVQSQFRSAGRTDKGVHQAGFLVLRETTMPSVLVELGYITTADEERFLSSSEGTTKMGQAIYNAFAAYYKGQGGGQSANAGNKEPAPAPAVSAKDETTAGKPTTTTSAVPSTTSTDTADSTTSSTGNARKIEFCVQFMSTGTKLKPAQYKGLDDVSYYMDGSTYRYTTGHFDTFAAAQRLRNSVAKKYKGAFVVALCDGKRMDLDEAKRKTK